MYIGRGENAEWLGSFAWDGYPSGMPKTLLSAKTDEKFRAVVKKMLRERDDATSPDLGWPWPWKNSQTTDYAYAFDEGQVWVSCFGSHWYKPEEEETVEIGNDEKVAVFPDMTDRQEVTLGKRSGIMIIRASV
jgi:hypothetical protein